MRVHAFGVCDDEDYFYGFIDQLLDEAGASRDVIGAQATPSLSTACTLAPRGPLFTFPLHYHQSLSRTLSMGRQFYGLASVTCI